eukprot:TRINITY_DN5911_c0_g1_i1.p1 TRINITY_DN5911_c0_g1~~TRINITY_DN5911_c0_g1_i1.p1  ORF type:complete len:1474 (+),score=374.20 TRINITY_DN5911_c0_g1_i1:60-4481(+)
MASGDLEFGELYAQIFRLRKRLDDLGEKDHDGEAHNETDAASMKLEVTRLEKKLKKVEKPQAQERKDDIEQRFAGHDNVMFLTRRALIRCVTLAQSKKFFSMMSTQAGEFGDPSGRVFTSEDVSAASHKVTCEFSRRELDEASEHDDDTSAGCGPSKAEGKGKGRGKAKGGGKGRGKAKAKAQAKAKQSGEGNEDDEEDPDLDAEQEIDLDVVLDEKEMRGLVDLFESPLEPVNDDCRRAWTSSLPAGSWVADDNALMGRLNKRGISLALDLMGRIPGPGQQSFNNYATARLQHKGISIDMKIDSDPQCPPLQPHQQAVEFLLHAASPIERLLVDHPTGCGKTREMIAVLNSYFHDPRPKIPIFPTESVCRNFYLELLRWPNRYRDFFCCEEPMLALRVAGLAPGKTGTAAAKAPSKTLQDDKAGPASECEDAASDPDEGKTQDDASAESSASAGCDDAETAPSEEAKASNEVSAAVEPEGSGAKAGDWKAVREAMWTLAGIPEAELRSIATRFRECLEMSGTFVSGKLRKGRRFDFKQRNPGEEFPSAPLRALGYTSAGGSNIKLDKTTGMPMSSLFKVGFGRPYSNVYDRKIILMDEVHNLVRSNTRYTAQLETLRKKLSTAENLVLVGFTATPIPNEKSEGRLLLDTIKGELHLGLSDEGFISSFPFKPPHLFPRSFPVGIPDVALTPEVQKELCCFTELGGDALLSYDLHAREPEIRGKQLRVYCNMFSHGSTFHDGKMGCKAELMARPQDLAPKLHRIVHAVADPEPSERTKALVLVRRSCGYNAMVALMREAGRVAEPPFQVATMANLSEFNSPENARGERFLVMIAETAECGEGISFKAVRRQYISDVPETPADFIQQCGRANRMYGHQVLDPDERTLNTQVFCAVLPEWLQDDALSVWCYRVFAKRGTPSADAERLGKELRRQFEELSVCSLDTLKVMLDFFSSRRMKEFDNAAALKRSAKPKIFKLGTQEIAEFLECLGLTEVAQALRQKGGEDENTMAQEEDEERRAVLASHQQVAEAATKHAETQDATDATMVDDKPTSGENEGSDRQTIADEATADCGDIDAGNADGAEEQVADTQDAVQILALPQQGAVVMDAGKQARSLMRALLKLHAMNREEVAKMAAESAQTEDQRALQNLKRLYDEFLPALSTIRNSAVDRMVLSRPEDRAILEAAAAVKSEDGSKRRAAVVLPAIDADMTRRLEALFPEKIDMPVTASTQEAAGGEKVAKRGRQRKMPDSDVPSPLEGTGDDAGPDVASANVGTNQLSKVATPARRGRPRKGEKDQSVQETPATCEEAPKVLRRARSKVSELQDQDLQEKADVAPKVLRRVRSKVSESQEQDVEEPLAATSTEAPKVLRRARSKTSEQIQQDQDMQEQASATEPPKAMRRARSKVVESESAKNQSKEPVTPVEAAKTTTAVQIKVCETCTYHNGLKRKRCEMCQTPLGAATYEEADVPAKSRRAA